MVTAAPTKIKDCRLCATPLPESPAIHLENVPRRIQFFPNEQQLDEDTGAELEVFQCPGCGLVQLNSEPVVYVESALSTTGFSQKMIDYRSTQMADFVARYNLQDKRLVDIGCGDGFLVEILQKQGVETVGVDPSVHSVEAARAKGLTAYTGYVGRDFDIPGGPFDAFVSTDVLEHVPDLKDFLQGISRNLKPGAVGLLETHNMVPLLAGNRVYDFVLDHLTYFTVDTLRLSLECSGFEVLHIESNRDDENLTAIVRKRPTDTLAELAAHTRDLQTDAGAFLAEQKAAGKRVAIWGASFQAITLSTLLPLDDVAYVIDSAPYKQGLYTPVSHLPIVSPAHLETDPVDVIVIMTVRYQDEIVKQIETQEQFHGTLAYLDGTRISVLKEV
jgi:SAM-dependent methyltransferase